MNLKSLLLAGYMLLSRTCPGIAQRRRTANNEGVAGTHKQATTKLADAAFAARHLLVKIGTDSAHVNVAGAGDDPYGFTQDQAAAGGDPIQVEFLGPHVGTILLNATGALAQGVGVYTAAGGYIQGEPAVAGTYFKVGVTKEATQETQDGEYLVEVESIKPLKVVVIAALTSAQNATTAAVDLPTSEALANALKANYNALQADVAAIAAAMATPCLVKHL